MVCQVALAAILLVATGLTARSLNRLTSVDVGFDASNVLTMDDRLPRNKYASPAAEVQFHRKVLERVRELLAGNTLQTYLFGVTAWDPLTYAVTGAALWGSSIAACCIPARPALLVDPITALRAE